MRIEIILADDHQIFRNGLRHLLEEQDDIQIVGEAEDGRSTVKIVSEHEPEVVIMDIGMPDLNGIEATKQITTNFPDVKVIALSMHSDKRFVSGMLQAGASGYLLKECAFDELITAVRTVMADRIYLSPQIAGIVVADYVDKIKKSDAPISILSDREREVLQLLAEGNSTKEIASQLFVSVKTIETHRQHIMDKLNMHTIAELTKFAVREGLTSLE